jgi:hypothetical protein
LNKPSHSAVVVIASLYATCGFQVFTATLCSLFNLSTIISRCNSHIQAIIVCQDSSSVQNLKDGSSCASFDNHKAIFS